MKRWMRAVIFLLALVGLVAAAAAETRDIGVVSVTAPGREEKIEDVQATVEVITQEEIQQQSGRGLQQVLQQAAGVTVQDGGGGRSQISIRGFDDGQTLILVDGLRRTGKFGSPDLGALQLADVERVEVVRGSLSALYGADAMGGVVNIVTKPGRAEPGADASLLVGTAEGAERETVYLRTSAYTGDVGATSHRLSFEGRHRESFREDSDQVETDLDDEDHLYFSYGGTADFTPTTRLKLQGDFFHQNDDGKYSDGSDTFEEEDRYFLGANLKTEPSSSYLVDVSAGFGRSMADSQRGGSIPESTDHREYQTNLFLTAFPHPAHIVTAGGGYRREEIELTVISGTQHRNNPNLLLQDQWSISEDVVLVAGLRYDDYSDFGDKLSPRGSLSWSPGNWNFRVGGGTAYRAPTFTELYGNFRRGVFDIRGNSGLDAEESWSVETAVGYGTERFGLEAIYHYSDVDNLIDWRQVGFIPPGPGNPAPTIIIQWENIDKATIQGVELVGRARPFDFWDLSLSAEYLDTDDDETNNDLLNRPGWQFKLTNALRYQDSSLFLHLRHTRDYYGLNEQREAVRRDFTVLDAKFSQGLFGNQVLSAGVDNVFDKSTPDNMGVYGSAEDPGARFYYLEYSINL